MVAGRRSVDSHRFSRGEAWPGVWKDGGAHHESLCTVDLSEGRPKERIDAKGRSSGDAPMAAGDGGPIPAGKSSSETWGGVEEVRDGVVEVLAEGMTNGGRKWPGRRRERAPLGSVWRRKKMRE